MIPIQERKEGVSFSIQVLPRSAQCALAGIQNDAIKIKITAPPVDGKANDECIGFLAELLGVRKGQIEIISGHASRKKIVYIKNATRKNIETRLAILLNEERNCDGKSKDGRRFVNRK